MMPSSRGQTERRANSCMVRMALCPTDRPHLRPGAHGRSSYSQPPGLSPQGRGQQCWGPEHCQAGSQTSHFSGQLFCQHSLVNSPPISCTTRAADTWIQRLSPGTLNKAVNEEVSSLNHLVVSPHLLPPLSPAYPHLRASIFLQTPPLL